MRIALGLTWVCLWLTGSATVCWGAPAEPGLLFYLSGEHAFKADHAAGGTPEPTFLRDVKVIADGARGKAFQCAGTQLMAYRAPGNIYAERGTLAFSWRSREPVGPTPFPIFRVAYADHSSWDMVWLRIDYNGRGGFDAFVTDINLSRVRVSYVLPAFPKPNEWVHLALGWDETEGIELFVNGVRAARKATQAPLHAGLDQFGPHSRIISPYQVQSAYNFVRGGDIDELRIYDRMLSVENVAALSRHAAPAKLPRLERNLGVAKWRQAWRRRHGWTRDAPPYLASEQTRVRKVEIHDVYDLKRWWWKATDGIAETTWPGVYNRSRLPGRNDYFQLPDWDCYSLSGQAVTFTLPDEPFNQLEIAGSAWGKMLVESAPGRPLFERAKGQHRTFHRLASALSGQKLRFENREREEPIGELSAYHVGAGAAPPDNEVLLYTLEAPTEGGDESLAAVRAFITRRYAPDERATLVGRATGVARAAGDSRKPRAPTVRSEPARSLPMVHIVIPAASLDRVDGGLDGITIDLPALDVKATHGGLFPLNVQVKDPLWMPRNLLDFSFSIKPHEPRRLWLDTRDRILPPGKAIYLTLAGAGADFGSASLEGVRVSLSFEPKARALPEHELDRFTQLRDSYAMLVEERPKDARFDLYNRFAGDVADLLRVNPSHWLAQAYWYDLDRRHLKPAFEQPKPPEHVPLWAFRQVEQLRNVKNLALWYIDHRQIDNGELGGGLSDDGDLTNLWPGLALMGSEPDRIERSLLRQLEAFYEQGLMTNGLSTIQTDELHAYEEGISVLSQSLLLDYANPKFLERAMETARALERLTAINGAGHRHMRSAYFSGTTLAEEEPWGWSREYSYLLTQVVLALVDFNGSPAAKRIIIELADGLLAHRKPDPSGALRVRQSVRFSTDEDEPDRARPPSDDPPFVPGRDGIPLHTEVMHTPNGRDVVLPLLWAAWRWTGDPRYLLPFRDEGPKVLEKLPANPMGLDSLRDFWNSTPAASIKPGGASYATQHLAWQLTGDKTFLESLYGGQIEWSRLREYINTLGSLWIDRVDVPSIELQRARLGGVALARNVYFPGHAVSWRFHSPASAESVAILIPRATPRALEVIVHNLSPASVRASMTAWDLEPGSWRVAQGIDSNRDDAADTEMSVQNTELERTRSLELTFPAGQTTVLDLALLAPGTPYWSRPDLAISTDDVAVRGDRLSVTIHSVGAVDAPPAELALVDASGKVLESTAVPAMKAPIDLLPKVVTLTLPAHSRVAGRALVLDPQLKVEEITRFNNRVEIGGP